MSKPRLLLIEDDTWLADSYAEALHEACVVVVAKSAAIAIDMIDEQGFDVIVADVVLEHGLVIDLLHELQSYGDTVSIPVIICSSLAHSMDLDDLNAYGVVSILDKSSLTPEKLRVAVQQALSNRGV